MTRTDDSDGLGCNGGGHPVNSGVLSPETRRERTSRERERNEWAYCQRRSEAFPTRPSCRPWRGGHGHCTGAPLSDHGTSGAEAPLSHSCGISAEPFLRRSCGAIPAGSPQDCRRNSAGDSRGVPAAFRAGGPARSREMRRRSLGRLGRLGRLRLERAAGTRTTHRFG